jgi:hypothetical protein
MMPLEIGKYLYDIWQACQLLERAPTVTFGAAGTY